MSQIDALRELDAAIAGAFLTAGLASTGTYTAPGTTGDPPAPHEPVALAHVMVDRNLANYGLAEAGTVAGSRAVVTLFLADVADPLPGAEVACDGETWELRKEIERDASLSQWLVTRA